MANEVDIVITGNSSGLEAAQKSASAAVDALNTSLAEQAAASGLASSADAALSDAKRAFATSVRDESGAIADLERIRAAESQRAADATARAVSAHEVKVTAAQAAAQREAAALDAVAAAESASAKEQAAAQRELDAARKARAKADAAVTSAAEKVAAASSASAAASDRLAAAEAKVTEAGQARARAAEAVREAEAGVAQASEVAASATAAAAAASDKAAQARLREAEAAAQASRTVSESQRQQAAPQMVGPAAPSARGLEYLESLRQQVAAQREQQILVEGGVQALARHRAAMAGVSSEAEHYISQLHGVAGAHGKATLTAGQMAQNMRMLPMQMGDVAVSLASGMPPIMVLMQQGMQIKDMYGSVGGALKAVGGYLLDLARNPMTLAAAATAVLVAGAWSASESQHALATAVTMSGAAAGLTASQLNTYAASAAAAAQSTSGAAVEAITMLTKSSAVVPEVMQTATEAALALDRSGGQAVEDTVKIFTKLGQDPLNAAIELDKSFGFLTAATYEQIKAAMESGDKHKAAQIAQEAYAASAKNAAASIVGEMGLLQSVFLKTKDIAGSMWQAIAGPGASKQDKEISALREKAALGEITGAEWDRLTALEGQKKAEESAAAARKKEQEQIQRKAEWDRQINDGLNQYLPKAERLAKLEEKIAQIKQKGALAGASQVEIDALIAQAKDKEAKIEKREEPKKPKKETGRASQTQLFEQELSELKASLAEKNAAEKTFKEFSKAEELKFWESKLSAVKAGSKEEATVRKKIADLKVGINRAEYEAEIASLKKSEDEAGKNAATKLALMQKTHAKIVGMYGKESEQAIQSAQRIAEAERAAKEQAQQLEEISAARRDGLAIAAVEAERAALDASVQLGLATAEQKLQAEQSFQDRIFEIKRAALEREKTLISPDKDPVAYQQILTKITELETQHTQQGQQIQRQQISQDMQGWKSLADGVGNAFGQTLTGIANGTATVGGVINSVAQVGMGVLSQLAAQWLSQQIMQMAVGKSNATGQISAAAGVAGANAVASTAMAPWPFNLSAPEVGAAMSAAAMSFAPMIAFSSEGGLWNTGSGNPIAQLHAEETVLPAYVAAPLRGLVGALPAMPAIAAQLPALQAMAPSRRASELSMSRSMGPAADARQAPQPAPAQTMTVHAPVTFSGLGDAAFKSMIKRASREVEQAVKSGHRNRSLRRA